MPLSLGILDMSPVPPGSTAGRAIADTLELARLADRLGYDRYWLAEHHSSAAFASAAPEILIGRVAQETRRIRVGSGGVMLTNYSPLKVAECFRMLEALYPGRVELGVGRAAGAPPRVALALQTGLSAKGVSDVSEKLRLLLGFLTDHPEEGHRFRGVHAVPGGVGAPPVWLLGSGNGSAALAGELGLAFCYAHFLGGDDPGVFEIYRQSFRPSSFLSAPRGAVAMFAICAETAEEARALAVPVICWSVRLVTGEGGGMPTAAEVEAEAPTFSPEERALLQARLAQAALGTPAEVQARLTAVARACGVDEVVVATMTPDSASRLRSYALLAEAFALAGAEAGAEAALSG
jgi:luciferase family oxidoreductase group 1